MKRSALRKISKKRVRHNLVYQKAKRIYMRDHPICEACICHPSESLHHRKGRISHLSNPEFFMAVCNLCHQKIELNRKWDFEMGYLLDRIGI